MIDRISGAALKLVIDRLLIPIRILIGLLLTSVLLVPKILLTMVNSFVPLLVYDAFIVVLTATIFGWHDSNSAVRWVWNRCACILQPRKRDLT